MKDRITWLAWSVIITLLILLACIGYECYQRGYLVAFLLYTVGGFALVWALIKDGERKKRKRAERWAAERTVAAFNRIDYMSGKEFEQWCAWLLEQNGFHDIRLTKASGDQGADVLAMYNGIPYAVQCKCYSKTVGNKAVQEVASARAFYRCGKAAVMTNSTFTNAAIDAAIANRVELWDRGTLFAMFRKQ